MCPQGVGSRSAKVRRTGGESDPSRTGQGRGGGEGGSERNLGSVRKGPSPRLSSAWALDSPRPEQPRRRPATASGSGKAVGAEAAGAPARPSICPTFRAPFRVPFGAPTLTPALQARRRRRRHQPARPRAQPGTEAGACRRRSGARAGRRAELVARFSSLGGGRLSARRPRLRRGSRLLARWEPRPVRGSRWTPRDSSQSRPRGGSAAPGRPRARPALAACAPPLPTRARGRQRLAPGPPQSPPGRAQFSRVS